MYIKIYGMTLNLNNNKEIGCGPFKEVKEMAWNSRNQINYFYLSNKSELNSCSDMKGEKTIHRHIAANNNLLIIK